MRSRNPRLDLDALQRQVDAELAREPQTGEDGERLARLAATVHARTIDAQLSLAEERSTPRTAWPPDLRVPFVSSSAFLKRAVLRVLALAFRDQHEANAALIRSQRELLALAQSLAERVGALEARLEDERAAARAERLAQRSPDEP
jgi:hypothetical protein